MRKRVVRVCPSVPEACCYCSASRCRRALHKAASISMQPRARGGGGGGRCPSPDYSTVLLSNSTQRGQTLFLYFLLRWLNFSAASCGLCARPSTLPGVSSTASCGICTCPLTLPRVFSAAGCGLDTRPSTLPRAKETRRVCLPFIVYL